MILIILKTDIVSTKINAFCLLIYNKIFLKDMWKSIQQILTKFFVSKKNWIFFFDYVYLQM